MEYSNVDNLILDIKECINKYIKDDILGFYLFGSLFNGDFITDISDIDFIAVLNHELDDESIQRIYNFFKNLKLLNPYADSLEGSFTYIPKDNPWKKTCTVWKDKNKPLNVEADVLDPDLVDYIVGKGLKIYGSDPQLVFPYVSTERLTDFSNNYILRIINNIDKFSESPNKLYNKLLNACRSSYFLCNENFANKKTLAAKWVMKKYPEYSYLIQRALNIRENKEKIKEISETDKINILKLMNLMYTKSISKYEGLNKPMRLEIQMTTNCNCNCPQCGYFTINKKENITEKTIAGFISTSINNWGWVDRVLFEGGEPTTDFEKLINCIRISKNLNIPNIQINSNFINLDEEKIKRLVQEGCNYFEVSVDAISENLWYLMRGITNNNNQFEKFIKNLTYACKMPGVVVDFNFTPTKLNIHEFEQAYKKACELGARYFSFQNLVCTTNEITNINVPNEILISELKKCNKVLEKYKFPPTILLCCLEAMNNGKQLENLNVMSEKFKCSCGEKYLYLNHKGEMRMCCFGDGLVLDKFDSDKFDEVWNNKTNDQFTGCPVLVKKLS